MTPKQSKNTKPANRRNRHHPAPAKERTLRIIPLGGLEEVGKNMTLFEYGNDILVLDMGLQFPEESMHGIDYIIPNISYLKGKEKNVRAVIFSHGHLDHIGAAPILLDRLGYPTIVGRPLTLAMVRHRQEDYRPSSTKNLKALTIKSIKDRFTFGSFRVSFFQVDHSIMDAVGVIIETPAGSVIHPGDWTLEKDAGGKPLLDYSHLARVRRPSILMLESLGAIDVRKSASHEAMRANLQKLIREAPGRLIIGTFASQIERINWIIGEAEQLGKKVALDGYSMKMNIEIAQKLGYVRVKKGTLIKISQIDDYPDDKLVIIATGAQGEGNAVLSRIITDSHKFVRLKKIDTVILSSSIIPGNENTIQRLKDELYRKSDNVIHGEIMDIHVSGHGNRDDIAHILKTVKPNYFVPVYAYHYMLREAAKLARDTGFDPGKIIVLDNGQVAEFNSRGGHATKEKADTSHVFVDGLGVGDVGNVVLKDRQVMAADGMVVVVVQVNTKTKKVINSPDIITRGFIHIKTSEKLMAAMRERIKKSTEAILAKHMPKKNEDWGTVRAKLREELSSFLFKETQREPMVLPVLIKT
ncbi:MAG: ribonuclease J [Parcubacteria group bacterium]|nr:ribonuclease J [Parcubacteria group bacterium]